MAARKRRAPQVRNYLAMIKGKVARKGATSDEIVAILTKDHSNAIRAETADILHIGLIKLANDVCSLRTGAAKNSTQLEMFAEYGTGPMVTLRIQDAKGRVRRVHKSVDALTLAEARKHVIEHTKQRPKLPKEITELARLVDDVAKYGKSDASSLSECWQAKYARP
jgi:hypothetical protein